MRYSNVSAVPLSVGVFLATDNYDHNADPNTISATTLLKPTRQLILASRVPSEGQANDLASMIASRMGSALHDAIERAWTQNYQAAMEAMGYPKRVIQKVKVNPDRSSLSEDDIPVYLEQRATKKVGKWVVSGKFDFVAEGRVEDFKSTSVWTYMNQTNDDKYVWQGSIYRWLNPEIITRDQMAIQFIFTDWSAASARSDSRYPQSRLLQKVFDLKPIQETEQFIRRKLDELDRYWDAPEPSIPHCNDEELWRKEAVYKYYADPAKTSGRSTRNFDSLAEANMHMATKGKGVVIEKPGEVTACKYCPGFMACSQKDLLIERGDLILSSI